MLFSDCAVAHAFECVTPSTVSAMLCGALAVLFSMLDATGSTTAPFPEPGAKVFEFVPVAVFDASSDGCGEFAGEVVSGCAVAGWDGCASEALGALLLLAGDEVFPSSAVLCFWARDFSNFPFRFKEASLFPIFSSAFRTLVFTLRRRRFCLSNSTVFGATPLATYSFFFNASSAALEQPRVNGRVVIELMAASSPGGPGEVVC